MSKDLSSDDGLDLLSTHQLLERIGAGIPEAADVVRSRHLARLQRWARGRLPANARDLMDTEELVQHTLTRALDDIEQFRSVREGTFQAHLRAGILSAIRDELRRGPAPRLADDTSSPKPSALEEIIGPERLERYEKAFSRLEPADQEVLFGRVELGLTYEDIARDTGRSSADAARTAVKLALSRLAREMAESVDGRT